MGAGMPFWHACSSLSASFPKYSRKDLFEFYLCCFVFPELFQKISISIFLCIGFCVSCFFRVCWFVFCFLIHPISKSLCLARKKQYGIYIYVYASWTDYSLSQNQLNMEALYSHSSMCCCKMVNFQRTFEVKIQVYSEKIDWKQTGPVLLKTWTGLLKYPDLVENR